MNNAVTSREELLEAAKSIAAVGGIASISIRAVASRCGISVGAIYNYFPTKADLVVGVIEDFWKSAFAQMGINGEQDFPADFIACFRLLYERLSINLTAFRRDYAAQLIQMDPGEKAMGLQKEADYFDRIRLFFCRVLQRDPRIPSRIWQGAFTMESFSSFVLTNLVEILCGASGTQDEAFAFMTALLERTLYP